MLEETKVVQLEVTVPEELRHGIQETKAPRQKQKRQVRSQNQIV